MTRDEILKEKGWQKSSLGKYRSSGKIKELNGFEVYIRKTLFDDFLKKSSLKVSANPEKSRVCGWGSKAPMGKHKGDLTPNPFGGQIDRNRTLEESASNLLPELGNFSKYKSLLMARQDKPTLLIGYDTEWQNKEAYREMLSYQFAFIWEGYIFELIFLRTGETLLDINVALAFILDLLNFEATDVRTIRRYEYCYDFEDDKPVTKITTSSREAMENAVYLFRNGEFTRERIADRPDRIVEAGKSDTRDWKAFRNFFDYSIVQSIKVCLLCHTGKVDISGMNIRGKTDLLSSLTEVQGGLVSLQPKKLSVKSFSSVHNKKVYPVSLSVADTMCHSPAGKKRLEDLGKAVGYNKLDIPVELKEVMGLLLEYDAELYFEYASTDAVVTLLYSSALYGYNNTPPVTVTSATAKVMKEYMMDYLHCSCTEEFNYRYRGLQKVGHGMIRRSKGLGYIEASSLEPINADTDMIQTYCTHSYHGGYNSCSEVGYFPFETFDYDMQNAYPTAMALVADVNWNSPIKEEIKGRYLTLEDFGNNPVAPIVAYVEFRFPSEVKYPTIPVNVDGIPVYPRSSDKLDGVYAASPFLYAALKLGAKVYCRRGFVLNTLHNPDCTESRSLASAVKQLVEDRKLAKDTENQGSLEELILKTMVNSGYGKNAQNVIDKSSWSARTKEMEDLGASAITNPFSAMMTTAIVQATLLSAQNEIHELGYKSVSVTTDGFISNVPEDILKSLELLGFAEVLKESRMFLTGKPEIWEKKHHQNDLINFTTRGNVSLFHKDDAFVYEDVPLAGVCAHNSAKSGFTSDTYEDRLWLMTQVLSRDGAVEYKFDEWTTFKDLVLGEDFKVTQTKRAIRMDYDMKRKPVKSSFSTDYSVVNGVTYEIAHFDTEPFENVEEFRLYRAKKSLTKVLRTEADWDVFWQKIELKDFNVKVRDIDWSVLNSVIMGYRSGLYEIPVLDDMTVEEKIDYINRFNTSKKKFKASDWKNARRPERQANMLPVSFPLVEEKLLELQGNLNEKLIDFDDLEM